MKNFIAALIFQVKDYDTGKTHFIYTTAILALEDNTSVESSRIAVDAFLSGEELKVLKDEASNKPGSIGVQLTSVSFLPEVFNGRKSIGDF